MEAGRDGNEKSGGSGGRGWEKSCRESRLNRLENPVDGLPPEILLLSFCYLPVACSTRRRRVHLVTAAILRLETRALSCLDATSRWYLQERALSSGSLFFLSDAVVVWLGSLVAVLFRHELFETASLEGVEAASFSFFFFFFFFSVFLSFEI